MIKENGRRENLKNSCVLCVQMTEKLVKETGRKETQTRMS